MLADQSWEYEPVAEQELVGPKVAGYLRNSLEAVDSRVAEQDFADSKAAGYLRNSLEAADSKVAEQDFADSKAAGYLRNSLEAAGSMVGGHLGNNLRVAEFQDSNQEVYKLLVVTYPYHRLSGGNSNQECNQEADKLQDNNLRSAGSKVAGYLRNRLEAVDSRVDEHLAAEQGVAGYLGNNQELAGSKVVG